MNERNKYAIQYIPKTSHRRDQRHDQPIMPDHLHNAHTVVSRHGLIVRVDLPILVRLGVHCILPTNASVYSE